MENIHEVLQQVNALNNEIKASGAIAGALLAKLEKKWELDLVYNHHLDDPHITDIHQKEIWIDPEEGHTTLHFTTIEAHLEAFKRVRAWAAVKERRLSEADILHLNKLILLKPYWKEAITADGQPAERLVTPGVYKAESNSVRHPNGHMFEYATPNETPRLMAEMVQWLANEEDQSNLHPVVIAALLHYTFIYIHPFDDGNGRTCRLLINYVLMKYGYPPVFIQDTNRDSYLEAIRTALAGDMDAFVRFLSVQLRDALLHMRSGATLGHFDLPGDFVKKLALLKLQLHFTAHATTPKSKASVAEAITLSICPFFEQVATTLHQLKWMFNESEVNYGCIAGDRSLNNLSYGLFQYQLTDLLETAPITSLSYQCSMSHLRSSPNPLALSILITAVFHENTYEVITPLFRAC